jgi:hypothetical protein
VKQMACEERALRVTLQEMMAYEVVLRQRQTWDVVPLWRRAFVLLP